MSLYDPAAKHGDGEHRRGARPPLQDHAARRPTRSASARTQQREEGARRRLVRRGDRAGHGAAEDGATSRLDGQARHAHPGGRRASRRWRACRAAFEPGGIITAGNASAVVDGAAAMVIGKRARRRASTAASRSRASPAWASPRATRRSWAGARSRRRRRRSRRPASRARTSITSSSTRRSRRRRSRASATSRRWGSIPRR